MDVVQPAGSVNVESVDEAKKTENTSMAEASEKIGSSGFDCRDRRKSKYLSYPYTNSGSRHKDVPTETEDLKTPSLAHKAEPSSIATKSLNGSSFTKLGSKRFQRNWYKNFISCNIKSSNPRFRNASPDELLSGLKCKAVNCMFPIENKNFDLVEWFFCKYRISEYHDEAELATSLVDEGGGKLGKSVGNDSHDIKSEKKRKNNKMENSVKPKMKSLSGLSDLNMNISPCDSLMPGKKLKQKRKLEEITSLNQLPNGEMTINESSRKCNSVLEATQNWSCLASEGKGGPKKREKKEAPQGYQIASTYVDAKGNECSSLVIDLQLASPPLHSDTSEKSKDENKEELVFTGPNPEIQTVSHERLVGNFPNHSLLVTTASEVGTFSVNKTGLHNKTEIATEKHLNTRLTLEIPDLNGTSPEPSSTRKELETVNFLSPEFKAQQPKSLSACSRTSKTPTCDRVDDSGESQGTCLLLQFAPGVYIPSKDDLLTMFCHFGPLKASETQLLKDTGSARIVFVRSSDAGEAFRSIDQNKPFGATLVNYKLHNLSVACPPVEPFVTPAQPAISMPRPAETPPLQLIKQNLQMMTSILENSGNNVSPQMKAKLDAEIKTLMRKVNSHANV